MTNSSLPLYCEYGWCHRCRSGTSTRADEQEPARKIHRTASFASEKSKRGHELEAGNVEPDAITRLRIEEADHEIKFRTLSWQKAALLLFGEYVCLAILALAWSWSVLGWLAGFFITFGMALITWYTSYTLWQWCLLHPECKNICDVARTLFVSPDSPLAAMSSRRSRVKWAKSPTSSLPSCCC